MRPADRRPWSASPRAEAGPSDRATERAVQSVESPLGSDLRGWRHRHLALSLGRLLGAPLVDSLGGGVRFGRSALIGLLDLTALSGSRAPVLRRIGRGDPGLRRAGVFGIGDAVAIAVDEGTAGALRIGLVAGRRQRAGIVAVGYAVAVLVGLRAAGAVRIGVRPLLDGPTLVFVVGDAVTVGVGDGDSERPAGASGGGGRRGARLSQPIGE